MFWPLTACLDVCFNMFSIFCLFSKYHEFYISHRGNFSLIKSLLTSYNLQKRKVIYNLFPLFTLKLTRLYRKIPIIRVFTQISLLALEVKNKCDGIETIEEQTISVTEFPYVFFILTPIPPPELPFKDELGTIQICQNSPCHPYTFICSLYRKKQL